MSDAIRQLLMERNRLDGFDAKTKEYFDSLAKDADVQMRRDRMVRDMEAFGKGGMIPSAPKNNRPMFELPNPNPAPAEWPRVDPGIKVFTRSQMG